MDTKSNPTTTHGSLDFHFNPVGNDYEVQVGDLDLGVVVRLQRGEWQPWTREGATLAPQPTVKRAAMALLVELAHQGAAR